MNEITSQIGLFLSTICCVLTISGSDLFAQPNMEIKTQNETEERARKADEFVTELDKAGMPGCAIGAISGGKFVYKRGFGLANLDYDIPITTTTRFSVASVSKAFTAMSIALLAQQGKLSLDDDIRKYIPEMPSYGDTITLRHLLNHTSGIREFEALVFFSGLGTDNAYTEKDIMNLLVRQKNLSFKPGSKYQYSNSGYQLLGMIVARVSGKSLRQFAEENIFKPLGMKNTLYFDNRFEVVKNRASGYMIGPGDRVRVRSSLYDLVGGGGVMTTVEDLYLWDQNFYEPKVGNKETIKLLTTPGTLNNGEKINYALGLFLNNYRGLPVFKHSGNMAGYRAQIATYPDVKFTAIALCNNSALLPPTIVQKLADIYLDGQFPAAAGQKKTAPVLPNGTPIEEKDAARYAGIYANSENGIIFRLSIKNGKLVNTGLTKSEMPVMLTADKHLVTTGDGNGYEMVPVFDKSGVVSEIKMLRGNGAADTFIAVKPPLDPLAEYVGTYYSEEFDTDYSIVPKGNGFVLKIGSSFEAPLTAAYADVFTTAQGQINLAFTRDAKGKITGFVFNSAVDEREVKGVAFTRKP